MKWMLISSTNWCDIFVKRYYRPILENALKYDAIIMKIIMIYQLGHYCDNSRAKILYMCYQ